MDIISIYEQNQDIILLSLSLIVGITIIKFITTRILVLLIVLIIGFDVYYFLGMSKKEQLDIKEQLTKAQDTKGEYVKKIKPMDLFSKDLVIKLKSNDIKNFDELKIYLDKNFELNEWKLKKIEEEEAQKAMAERRKQLSGSRM